MRNEENRNYRRDRAGVDHRILSLIIAAYAELVPDGSYPSIIINSIDLKKLVDMVAANELEQADRVFGEEIQRLARAGAECGLVAANTPHIVFDEVRRQSPIPLISIVEATCEHAKALGLRKLGLFGTRSTMQGNSTRMFFPKKESRLPSLMRVTRHSFITFISMNW